MEKRILSDEEIAFLDQYRHNWDTLRQAGYIGHLLLETREQLLKIARRFDFRYLACLTCPDDVAVLVRYVYTQADKDTPPANPEPPAAIVIEPNGPEVSQETAAPVIEVPNDTPPETGSAPAESETPAPGHEGEAALSLAAALPPVGFATPNQAKQAPAEPEKTAAPKSETAKIKSPTKKESGK